MGKNREIRGRVAHARDLAGKRNLEGLSPRVHGRVMTSAISGTRKFFVLVVQSSEKTGKSVNHAAKKRKHRKKQ
jgi:hypothetical protein